MKEPIAVTAAGGDASITNIQVAGEEPGRHQRENTYLVLCMIPTAVNGQTENVGAAESR